MKIFRGAATALVTPFDHRGEVDFEVWEQLVKRQISSGISALIVCGTTGEPSTLTTDEKQRLISSAIRIAEGRLPVIAGTGGNNTKKVIEDSIAAEDLGADALLIVTPYYNKTSPDGLTAHYHAVADQVKLPIIVYNVPSRTGLNVTPSQLASIATHPGITAMKEASGDIKQLLEMKRLCPDMAFYSGTDEVNLPLLACGGDGVISVVSNVVPRQIARLCDSFFAGDLATTLEIQLSLMPLIAALFSETNPIPAKAALSAMGLCEDVLRLPLVPMSDAKRAALLALLKDGRLI